MFGINLPEFSVIIVIALVVVGPERLPRYAQQLGRFVREGRKMALGLREQVREELGPEFDEVDWRKLDPRQYDPRRIVREALSDAWDDDEPSPPRPSGATAAGQHEGPTGTPSPSGPADGGAPVSLTKPTPAPEAPFDAEAT